MQENVSNWIRITLDHLSIKAISGGYRAAHTEVGDEKEAACFVVSELAGISLLGTTLVENDSDNESEK